MKASKRSPVLERGTRLTYDQADFDASDTVTFETKGVKGGIEVAVIWGKSAVGTWKFAEAAVERATETLAFAQGGAKRSAKPIAGKLPPFLLSRAALAALKKGSVKLDGTDFVASGKAEVAVEGLGTRTIVRGKGGGGELWVLDDERWPLVVRREEADDNYWRLKSPKIGKAKFEPFVTEATRALAKAATKGDDALAAALRKKGASTAQRVAAIKKARTSTSPAIRDALVDLMNDGEMDVDLAAEEALQLPVHRDAPEFWEQMAKRVSKERARVGEDASSYDQPFKIIHSIVGLALADSDQGRASRVDASPAFGASCRDIARTHVSPELRAEVRRLLVMDEDAAICDELLEKLDHPKALVPAESLLVASHESALVRAVVDLALERGPVKTVAPKLDALIAAFGDKRRDEIYDLVRRLARYHPAWKPMLPRLDERSPLT